MKTFISLVVTLFLFVSTAPMVQAGDHAHSEHAAQTYHCPMHPEVVGEKGDTCPKCGMNLELVKAAGHHDGKACENCPKHQHKKHQAAYHCPMHPEVVGDKGDTCPKCGMNLEAMKAEKAGENCKNCPKHKQQMQTADYHCPMHPEVVGDKGDTCPKCGMNLEKVSNSKSNSKSANAHNMQHQH
ncbi:hypothetical protein L1D21_12985 [Shewanella sp. Isolate11]|nr:heavy metal-binding domain-containing protein [Shewanella sp. Isolate11]MCG9697851.1 hypothetical protein [Shewanella sp. Isolate11]